MASISTFRVWAIREKQRSYSQYSEAKR